MLSLDYPQPGYSHLTSTTFSTQQILPLGYILLQHSTSFCHFLCHLGRFQHQETENALRSFCNFKHITSMKQKSAILNPNREALFFFGGKTTQTFRKHLQNLSFEVLRKESNMQHQKLQSSLYRKNEEEHRRDLLIHKGNYFLGQINYFSDLFLIFYLISISPHMLHVDSRHWKHAYLTWRRHSLQTAGGRTNIWVRKASQVCRVTCAHRETPPELVMSILG